MKQKKTIAVVLSILLMATLLVATADIKNVQAAGNQSMYRLYNESSGEHFYTADENERSTLVGNGWKAEGVAWVAPSASNTPVYRLYNPNSGEHHYTTAITEKDALANSGWTYEGIGWYSDDNKGEALFRVYNPNAKGQHEAGSHHYTVNVNEMRSLINSGWQDENIGWYGIKGGSGQPSYCPDGFTVVDSSFALKEAGRFSSFGYTYHYILAYNFSDKAKDITLKDISYNASGDVMAVKSTSANCIEPGKTDALWTMHESDKEDVSSFSYSITDKDTGRYVTPQYDSVDLSASLNADKSKVIVSASNNSNVDISYTQVYVLFYKNNKLVGADWNYLELPANGSDIKEFERYGVDFDAFEVYYTAYSYNYNY